MGRGRRVKDQPKEPEGEGVEESKVIKKVKFEVKEVEVKDIKESEQETDEAGSSSDSSSGSELSSSKDKDIEVELKELNIVDLYHLLKSQLEVDLNLSNPFLVFKLDLDTSRGQLVVKSLEQLFENYTKGKDISWYWLHQLLFLEGLADKDSCTFQRSQLKQDIQQLEELELVETVLKTYQLSFELEKLDKKDQVNPISELNLLQKLKTKLELLNSTYQKGKSMEPYLELELSLKLLKSLLFIYNLKLTQKHWKLDIETGLQKVFTTIKNINFTKLSFQSCPSLFTLCQLVFSTKHILNPSLSKLGLHLCQSILETKLLEPDFNQLSLLGQVYLALAQLISEQKGGEEQVAENYALGIDYLYQAKQLNQNDLELNEMLDQFEKLQDQQ